MSDDKKDYYGEEAFSHLPADYGQRCTDNFRREQERVVSDGNSSEGTPESVKRFWIIGNEVYDCEQQDNAPLAFPTPQIEAIPITDHDRIVAELKAAAYKVYQQMSATIGHDKNTIDELRAEVERLTALSHNTTTELRDLSFLKMRDLETTIAELRAEVVGLKEAMHNAASGLSMEIKKRMLFEKQLLYARAEVEELKRANQIIPRDAELLALNGKFRDTIATQARVIEIAKRVLHNAGLRPPDGGTPTVETICEDLSDAMTEIAAIERGGES